MKKLFLILLLSLMPLLAAAQQERILDFAVDIAISQDGTATVKEAITIDAQHNQIRRGIFRDIPASTKHPVIFDSLSMDGSPHPYFTETNGKYLRVNFGDDNYISRGVHTYELTYTMANIVLFKKDYDELYWNVTGNYWNFPIDKAYVTVRLPQGANIIEKGISVYTGYEGHNERNAVQTGPLSFETTKPLMPREGFTIAIPWAKGLIQAPKELPKSVFSTSAMLLVLITFIYYIKTWLKYGKDPSGLVPTEYKPPEGISPALMRYLYKRRKDMKSMASAIAGLVMKNKLEITQQKNFLKKETILTPLDRNTEGLWPEEKLLISEMFYAGNPVTLNQDKATLVKNTLDSICKSVGREGEKYIESNRKFLYPPLIVMAVLLAVIALMSTEAALPCLFFLIFSFTFVSLSFNKGTIMRIVMFLVITTFFAPFITAIVLDNELSNIIYPIGALLIIHIGFLIYYSLIDNIKPSAYPIYYKILGFQRYMSIAEEGRVELSNPEEQERIFCDYLPFAFALDMENKWIKKFEKILSAAAIDKAMRGMGGRSLITGALMASLNSAKPKRSASNGGSGSFGGGFSGGGFGGGGGGGR